VQKKGARSRAETEIAAMSAACESYKADNGVYPSNTATNGLDPTSGDPSTYESASQWLYEQLSGDTNANRKIDSGETGKSYISFKPSQLSPTDQSPDVKFIRDPFGNSYGYSTAKASTPAGTVGYNPTFDLWSTAGTTTGSTSDRAQWTTNW
jgi:hypothetical protein